MTQICLITQAHIAHNPRLIKEADSLSAAGYSVRVVSRQVLPALTERDNQMMQDRRWKHDPVVRLGSGHAVMRRLRTKFFHRLATVSLSGGTAEKALFEDYPTLLKAARTKAAALYIAHNLEALPVAYAASRKHRARLAFDAEDLHSEEFSAAEANCLRKRVVAFIESRYLPQCDYISAPSPEVADALVSRYQVARPLVVYNTFPWKDRDSIDGKQKDRRGDALSLYWYSQTIGLDRGLQDVIRAAGLLNGQFQIHLRGMLRESVRVHLSALARECGVLESLFFHETVSPSELLSRASEHDVGLALENVERTSRALSVSNKMFLYMLAGLGVAATNIPGQRSVLESCPTAGFLYHPGDFEGLARQLQDWLTNRSALVSARRASLEAARARWNWETESLKFVKKVSGILSAGVEPQLAKERGIYSSSAATP
jgi:glycosyltransferase involved in cell wall biosynthesis